MFAILDNFKKNIEVEERESAPRQIVAVGVHWDRHVEHLLREFMSEPSVVITALEEGALYGSVQQVRRRACAGADGLNQWPLLHGLILKDDSSSFRHKSVIFKFNIDLSIEVYIDFSCILFY